MRQTNYKQTKNAIKTSVGKLQNRIGIENDEI